jgi:2-iminobutanoate/2-iminopropanoate deaminase
VAAAARNALENVKAILEEGGSGLDHVLKVTLYLRSMDDFQTVNEVYTRYFASEPRPARALVLLQGARSPVSFDAIAYVPD